MIDTTTWARTQRGKLICPDCGQTGWPVEYGPSWLDKHTHHTDCECGRRVPTRTIASHRRHHKEES